MSVVLFDLDGVLVVRESDPPDVYPEVQTVLRHLHTLKIPMALISYNAGAMFILHQSKLRHYFQHVMGQEDDVTNKAAQLCVVRKLYPALEWSDFHFFDDLPLVIEATSGQLVHLECKLRW
jgi:phosphoglycolate phosphatase-like HAD superfamily hydrolase